MIEALKCDLRRYYSLNKREFVSLFSVFRKTVFAYGLHAIAVYRFGRWVETRNNGTAMTPIKGCLILIYNLLAWVIRKAYGINLSNKADIGPGLYIGHFGGIKVGPCTIGSYCSIQQHTKILPNKATSKPSHIGSKVWIGAHAVIEGCTIGDHATIAAGAHVKKDIEPGHLAAGNPARVVSKNYNNKEILGIIL